MVRIRHYSCGTLLLLPLLFVALVAQGAPGWSSRVTDELLIYAQDDVPDGQLFTLIVLPAEVRGKQSLANWFALAVKRLQGQLGPAEREWAIDAEENGVMRAANSFHHKRHGRVLINYRGSVIDDDRFLLAYLLSSPQLGDREALTRDLRTIMNEATAVRLADPLPKALASSDAREDIRPETNTSASDNHASLAVLPPNEGVDDEQIEVVWLDLVPDLYYGGLEIEVSVLFKDGTVYLNCTTPINDLDVARSRELQPEQWSRWRDSETGSGMEIQAGTRQQWRKLEGWQARKAGSEASLDGTFTMKGGSERAGSFSEGVRLTPDGRFELSSFSMHGAAGDDMPSVTTATASDKTGTRSSTSISTDAMAGSDQRQTDNGDAMTGHYRVDG